MAKVKKCDLSIETTFQGAYRISAIIDGYLTTRQFFGYSKREAVRLFLAEFNTKEV